jgi:hypothetical protein
MGALMPILMVFDLHQAEGENTKPITKHETIRTQLFFIAILPLSA